MLPLNDLLAHSLYYGALLSALLSVLIIGSLYYRPMIWIDDAPAVIQAAALPMSAGDRRAKQLTGALFFAIMFGVAAVSLWQLRELSGGTLAYVEAALSLFIIFETFNLVDLLILDWLLIEWWQPAWLAIPGAEGLRFTRGYAHHFHGFLIGTALSAVFGLLLGAVAVVLL